MSLVHVQGQHVNPVVGIITMQTATRRNYIHITHLCVCICMTSIAHLCELCRTSTLLNLSCKTDSPSHNNVVSQSRCSYVTGEILLQHCCPLVLWNTYVLMYFNQLQGHTNKKLSIQLTFRQPHIHKRHNLVEANATSCYVSCLEMSNLNCLRKIWLFNSCLPNYSLKPYLVWFVFSTEH